MSTEWAIDTDLGEGLQENEEQLARVDWRKCLSACQARLSLLLPSML